jgi:hypothetical protein
MAHFSSLIGRALLVVPALAFALSTAACTSNVVGGGSGEGGDGTGGDEGQGGGAVCEAYAGDGCAPGDYRTCGPDEVFGGVDEGAPAQTCALVPGEACATAWGNCELNTPLVLSFDGGPVQYLADRAHAFDVNGAASIVTDWPTASTPWLAVDRDGNGAIDDGSELFGSLSPLAGGGRAPNGFAALRELDADGDGRITPADPGFAKLLVWSDRDGDRRSSPGELASAASFELLSIDLAYRVAPSCDARGNCEVERAAFHYRDAAGVVREGTVVDVHLARQR